MLVHANEAGPEYLPRRTSPVLRYWRTALTIRGPLRPSLLYRAAMSGVVAAATEAMDEGTFSYVAQVMSSAEVAGYMRR